MKYRLRLPELAKIKAHKEGRTINKHVVSSETGVSYPTIYKYWDNDTQLVHLEILAKLATYFECQIEDLLELTTDPNVKGVRFAEFELEAENSEADIIATQV